MRPDTPVSETDPADALEQRREAAPEPEEEPDVHTAAAAEADPADVVDQARDTGPADPDY